MGFRAVACGLAFVSATAWAAEPSAPAPQPKPDLDTHFFMPIDLRFRTQPVGIALETSAIYRDTYRRDGSKLFDGVYWETGADLVVSPAFAEVGAHVEWLPIKIFKLRAEYHLIPYFGAVGYMLSYPSADADYGDAVEDAREGEEEAGLGHRFSLQPTVQFKFGPVVVRNSTNLYYYLLDGFDGPYQHERLYDRLIAQHDGIVANTSFILFQAWEGTDPAQLLVGPYFEYATTFADGNSRMRVGGTLVYIPHPAWGRIHKPRLVLQAGANLQDTNRPGAFYIQGGIGIDLWFRNKPVHSRSAK